jgi:hypothetical protein
MISDLEPIKQISTKSFPQLKIYKFSLTQERRRDGRNCKDPNYIVATTKIPGPKSHEAGQSNGSSR